MEILKIIETLQSYSENVVAYKLDGAFAGAVTEAVALLVAQGEKIAELEEKNRWVPVTEGLPEDDERLTFYDDGRMRCTTVLAYTEYGRIIPKNRLKVRAVNNAFLDTQVTDGWIWSRESEDITHWVPMLEPPKEV